MPRQCVFRNAVVKVSHNYWQETLNKAVIKYLSRSHFRENYRNSNKFALMQVSFIPVGSKQNKKMNTHSTMTLPYHSKVPFYFVWCMDFSIISPCFGKSKNLLSGLTWQTLSTFNVCMKTLKELYVFLTEFIICLQKLFCYSAFRY